MKHILAIIFILFSFLGLHAQGNINYNIKVLDNDNKPLKNIAIVATEKYTFHKIKDTTDNFGKATLQLNNGIEWIISVGEIKNAITIIAIAFTEFDSNCNYYYDLEKHNRTQLQNINRTTENYKVVNDIFNSESNVDPAHCLLEISVIQPNGTVLPNINVDIVEVSKKVVYKSITNNSGNSYFVVPNNSKYDIDINGLINVSYCDFADEYKHHKLSIVYAPTIVKEHIINDTIYQTVTENSSPSSERALIKINISGGKRKGKNEPIYLRELKTNKIYASKSDESGAAFFLIPIKHIYMIDFNYEKDVDVVNLQYSGTLTKGTYEAYYSPDPKLEYPENYIPKADRLLIKNFNSFLTKQFKKPIDSPFLLNIKSVLKINKNSKEALFLLTLAGGANANKRLPLNLSLVLDQSGSMYSSERSESLKKSLWKLGDVLKNSDKISIILFDDEAIKVEEGNLNHIEIIENVIKNYEPAGGTNIFNGLKLGTDNIIKSYNPNSSNKLILLTDGYGIDEPKYITNYVDSISNKDITVSTIGLGNNYNQSLLELISKKGNGTFSHVDNSVHLSNVFLNEIESSFNYFAKDVKIDIYHDEKLIYSNLYGFPTKSVSDRKISFEISKISSNYNRIAYLQFNIDKLTKEISDKPLIIKVSYFDITKAKYVNYEQSVLLEWTDETDTKLLLDQEEKMLYAIAILNQSLKIMADQFEFGNNKSAKAVLLSTKKQVEEIFPDAKPKDVNNLINEIDNYINCFIQLEKNNSK